MRYVAAWLLFVAVVAYFTAGLGTLWLLHEVIGMDPEQADQIAKYSFVGNHRAPGAVAAVAAA